MGKALYRKYRSKSLGEIVGQEHITTTLDNALKKGNISHAYLFTGPRGVGKTSIARILAHEVNGLPYDEETTHLDIIEIDAASNRRIDEIRTLRERVHNAPTSAKYKVYIIDEVHMLTREAFNALLKTLEEPPEHVIFILATTEVHKLPETIISRTQRFSFKPAAPDAAAAHLKNVAKKEGIIISDDALALLAEHGGGSFRDSMSLLDQVSNSADKVELSDVQRMLGIAPEEAISQLLHTLQSGSQAELITQLQAVHEQGFQAAQIARQLGRRLRQGLIEGNSPVDPELATRLMQELLDVPASHDPQALLEIILLGKIANTSPQPSRPVTVPEPPKPEIKPEITAPPQAKSEPQARSEPPAPPSQPVAPVAPGMLDEQTWQQTLHALKQKHNTLYGIVRMATPQFADNTLTLAFAFPFHQKRLDDPKNKQILSQIITDQTGLEVIIMCIVDKKADKAPSAGMETTAGSNSPIDAISNIFGSAEVLE